MTRRMVVIALLLTTAAAACEEGSGPSEPPAPQPLPAPVVTGEWDVTHVRDMPLPAAVFVEDTTTLDGRLLSVHFVVDSARIRVDAGGRYVHRVWATEWHGDPWGPPRVRIFQWYHGDFGAWQRDGVNLSFESEWLMNHRMTGTFAADGVLRMEHGFSPGDAPVPFRYGRTAGVTALQ
jgi:hypothetical protein